MATVMASDFGDVARLVPRLATFALRVTHLIRAGERAGAGWVTRDWRAVPQRPAGTVTVDGEAINVISR